MGDSESCSSRASEWSPIQSRKKRQKIEVYYEVLRRLRELNGEEALSPEFEAELWSHFSMLPLRYFFIFSVLWLILDKFKLFCSKREEIMLILLNLSLILCFV